MMHASASKKNRLGFHYFPDTLHYRECDLRTWLPALRSLNASWVTLLAPYTHAIPEAFISGLVAAGIQPVLHLQLPINPYHRPEGLELLFRSYSAWGVEYVVLYDRPNSRASWPASYWAFSDLVERFLDQFLPAAELAVGAGLKPVFPPLEPGGDYWDTAFLPAALRGIRRRGHHALLERLAISAYGWAGDRPLDWGAGGPERWPAARPYFTPAGSQDQRGFRIFDWYLSLAEAALGYTPPMFLLATGNRLSDGSPSGRSSVQADGSHSASLEIAKSLLAGRMPASAGEETELLPEALMAGNLWLLAAGENSPHRSQAWFSPQAEPHPVASAFRQFLAQPPGENHQGSSTQVTPHPLRHYLLLPGWGRNEAGEGFDLVQAFIDRYHPTVGFSLEEARQAARVTVVGGRLLFPDEMLESLWKSGCTVERLEGIGLEEGSTDPSGRKETGTVLAS